MNFETECGRATGDGKYQQNFWTGGKSVRFIFEVEKWKFQILTVRSGMDGMDVNSSISLTQFMFVQYKSSDHVPEMTRLYSCDGLSTLKTLFCSNMPKCLNICRTKI